jgi:muramidase (phage lysozyme)
MGTLHFSGADAADAAQTTQSSSTAKATNNVSAPGEKGASRSAPPAAASSAIATFDTSVAYSGSMTDQVKQLIDIATEQTGYEIAGGTQNFLSKEKNGTKKLKEYPVKGSDKAKGFCYAYVKIALMRANIISTAPGNEAASDAGPELLSRGFTDVTDSVPDPRWAAAGDVIVYAWTPKTLEDERRKVAFGKKVKEYKKQGKKIDFQLADVSPADSNKPNFGHIDIRSYEGYISDHIPPMSDKDPSPGEPHWTRYNPSPRIYRKVYDPMPTLRITAFLRCLREYECTSERDDAKRFNMLNAALPSNLHSWRFDSYQSHPWQGNGNPAKGSTAAGAYQILYKTWKEKFDTGLIVIPEGKDKFSPEVQHRIAVMKLYDRNALNHIRKGEIEQAISDTTLPGEWSSLPGGNENSKRISADGKPMDMAYFLSLFNQYLEEVKRKVNLK